MQTSTPLTAEQFAAWRGVVIEAFPNEACAFICDGQIVPVANISPNPTTTFQTSAVEVLSLRAQHTITGFLHSHPATPDEAGLRPWPVEWPSGADVSGWLADSVRWGISATDGENVTQPIWMDEDHIAPLEGRPFISGIWDCYSAIRDWYRVHRGITLKNYARGMEWWLKGQNLYEDNFADAGFTETTQPEVGDIALMSIGSRGVICHAAVMDSPSTLYHHTFSRTGQALSGTVSLNRWSPFIVKWLRYTNATNTSSLRHP